MKKCLLLLAIVFFSFSGLFAQFTIEPIIHTFLGDYQRNYYGNAAPNTLDTIWKLYLGKGKTVISRAKGEREWEGAGWTGQPLLVKENGELFLIQGAYDHNLKKIKAETGEIVWQYQFDDVIKGTGSLWHNSKADDPNNEWVILQGSRLGVGNYLDSKHIPSYRAISYITGKELWRLDVRWGASYSRDVDASAVILKDTAYIGLENAYFTIFSPDPKNARIKNGMLQPQIFEEHDLFEDKDVMEHKYNVVTESSPALLNNKLYLASGSGHIYGFNLESGKLDWKFDIGSDIDGSAIVTRDSCILVSIEKQYIEGHAGAFKLNPRKKGNDAVEWYFPVNDKEYVGWEGGIIGSIGTNDRYISDEQKPLSCFVDIEGFLYVVSHEELGDTLVSGPNNKFIHKTPKLIYKHEVGPSISTPIITENKLIAATYEAIYLFEFDKENNFKLLDSFPAPFESTPIIHNNRIYVASRDGFLYCFGNID